MNTYAVRGFAFINTSTIPESQWVDTTVQAENEAEAKVIALRHAWTSFGNYNETELSGATWDENVSVKQI